MEEANDSLALPGLAWAAGPMAMTETPSALDCWREDRRLVERMLAGDAGAFAEFTRDVIPVLYRFAGRRLHGDEEATREVVQATLCVAMAKLGQFRGRAALTTWLCACCRNEIAAHFRRREKFRAEPLEDAEGRPMAEPRTAADGPERSLLRRENAALVHAALDELPRQYSRVLEWKYLDDLSVDEIGRRLERGTKAAESMLTRAREAFRAAYARLLSRPRAAGSPAAEDETWVEP